MAFSSCLRCGCAFRSSSGAPARSAPSRALPAPRCSPMYGLPLSVDGHGGHRLHAVRRGRHGGGRLPGGMRAAAGEVISVCLLGSAVLLALVGTRAVARHRRPGGGLHRWPGHRPGRPSRDMLIKLRCHLGATGRAMAPCTRAWTWLCLAAPVFGAMLDRGMTCRHLFGSAPLRWR